MYKYALILLFILNFLHGGQYRLYKARKGDSYYTIGRKFHINYLKLAQLNKNRRLRAGEVIKIPGYYKYKIKEGDNLYRISAKLKVKVKEIMKHNPGVKKLYAGRYLRIPMTIGSKPGKTGKKEKTVRKRARDFTAEKEETADPLEEIKRKEWIKAVMNTRLRFVSPVSGKIKNGFGVVEHIMNYGLVFQARQKRVVAAAEGTVVFSGFLRGLGRTVIVSHPDNFITLYAGLGRCYHKVGGYVKQGRPLASLTGTELFFSILNEGDPFNPGSFLNKKGGK